MSRPHRIAMVGACPYPVPQGSQVLLRNTASALHAAGHVVRLVVYGHGADGELGPVPVDRAFRLPGVTRTAAGPSITKPFLDAALAATLRRVMTRHGLDVIHAHNAEALLVASAAWRWPVVYHAHNALAEELPWYFRGSDRARRFGAWFDRIFPKSADHVIAPHGRLADYYLACGCREDRVTVVPPSVEFDRFTPSRIGAAVPPVLYTGNVDAYQNLAFLDEVMERVRRDVPGARLVVGTASGARVPGAETAPLPDFAALRDLLEGDSVFVCPRVSWSGYPIKLVNAMAAGKAIVACEGAAHGLVHGETALIVPDNDATAFANAAGALLMDPDLRRRLGAAARAAARENHDPARIAALIESIYEDVLGQ